MSLSFTLRPQADRLSAPAGKRVVLITGAGGHIGSYFAEHGADSYDLRLLVHHPEKSPELGKLGRVIQGDTSDLNALKEVFAGVDTVLHLAGDPSANSTWESLHQSNIVGTYNVMVAAKAAGCKRVIYASSIHAVSGYPPDVQVKTSDPVNPGDLYGVTKCFCEALGRYMAEKEGLSVIALRIGAFQPIEKAMEEAGIWMANDFVSPQDLTQLIRLCIDDQTLQFAIFHGLSNNRFKRLDITDARELVGYAPEDDVEKINPAFAKLPLEKVESGSSVTPETSGLRDDL